MTIASERRVCSPNDVYNKSMFQIMKPGRIQVSNSQPKKLETLADFKEILGSITDRSTPSKKVIE